MFANDPFSLCARVHASSNPNYEANLAALKAKNKAKSRYGLPRGSRAFWKGKRGDEIFCVRDNAGIEKTIAWLKASACGFELVTSYGCIIRGETPEALKETFVKMMNGIKND